MQFPKTTKKKQYFLIGGIFLLCCIIAICISFFHPVSPKKTVLMAINKTLQASNTTLSDTLHYKDFRKILADGKTESSLNLTLTELRTDIPETAFLNQIVTLAPRLSMHSYVNYPEKKMMSSIQLGCGGSTLLSNTLYANHHTIALESPLLFDDALSINSTTLASDYNNSALCTLLGNHTLDDTVHFDLFDRTLSEQTFLEQYQQLCKDDFKELYDNLTVEEINGTDITLPNHTPIHANGYELSLSGSLLKKNMEHALPLLHNNSAAFSQEISNDMKAQLETLQLPETITFMVYIDPDSNEMLKLSHSAQYMQDNSPYQLDCNVTWNDTQFPMDHMDAILTLTPEKKEPSSVFKFQTSASSEDTLYKKTYHVSSMNTDFLLSYVFSTADRSFQIDSALSHADNTKSIFQITGNGSFTEITAGKSLSIDLDTLAIDCPQNHMYLEFSGDYSLQELNTPISSPDTLRPLFEMDENNLYGFIYEVMGNLNNPANGLTSFMH